MENSVIQILFDDGIQVSYDNLDELAKCSKIPRATLRHLIAAKKKIPGVLCITINPKQTEQTDSKANKAVVQYDEYGNKIQTFKNASEAQRQTGISNIYKALSGLIDTAGGYVWKYTSEFAEDKIEHSSVIVLLSDKCEILGVYNTLKEAADDTCIDVDNVTDSIRALNKTQVGYFIRLNDKQSEIIELHKNGSINKIYKKLCHVRLKTGLTNSQICNSYTRNSYIGDVKYIRLESLIENIRHEQ